MKQILSFASREALEEWLAEHHDVSEGIWLKIAKKASGVRSVSYAEAIDVALCFGWIDGQKEHSMRDASGVYFSTITTNGGTIPSSILYKVAQ